MRLKALNYDDALTEHKSVYRSLRSTWIFNQTPSDMCSILVEKGPSCKHMQKCVANPQRTASLLKSCLEISLYLWLNKGQGWLFNVDYELNAQNQDSAGIGWNICWSIFVSQTQVIYITDLHHKGITIMYLRSPQKKKKCNKNISVLKWIHCCVIF